MYCRVTRASEVTSRRFTSNILWSSACQPELLLMFEFQLQISDFVMENLNIFWTNLKFTWHICKHLEIYEFHLENLNISYKVLKFICLNWILSKNIWISSWIVWKWPGNGVVTALDTSSLNCVIKYHINFHRFQFCLKNVWVAWNMSRAAPSPFKIINCITFA